MSDMPDRARPLPLPALAAALLVTWAALGCGAAPQPDPVPAEDRPPAAFDDAKPGEHGCGSCAVRACDAGGAVAGLWIELKLSTDLRGLRYDRALVRIGPATGGGQVFQLDPAKLEIGARTVQRIDAEKLGALSQPADFKGASGALMLYWDGPKGPDGQQLPLDVEVGPCP